MSQSFDALVEYYRGASKQDKRIDKSSKEREAAVAKGESVCRLMTRDALKHPCQGDRHRAPEVMDGIRDDGHTVGQPSSDDGYHGEGEVDEEGRKNVLAGSVAMQMDMIVCHKTELFTGFRVIKHAKVRIYEEFSKINATFVQ